MVTRLRVCASQHKLGKTPQQQHNTETRVQGKIVFNAPFLCGMANTVALNLGAGDQRVVFAPRPRNAPHKLRRASGHSPPVAGRFRPQRACSASPGPGEKWPLGALEGRVQGQGPRQITPRIEQGPQLVPCEGPWWPGLSLVGAPGALVGPMQGPQEAGCVPSKGPRWAALLSWGRSPVQVSCAGRGRVGIHHQNKVCGRTGEEADSGRFLRPYGGHAPPAGPTPRRTASRWAPGHRSMPLGEIQRLLKNQVAGRSLAPVFRSFDPRGEGRVRRRDFRRVLSDCCCFLLTDREFERLWDHYSPDRADDMAYTDFLRKLEDSSPQTLALGPVCTRMELSSPRVVTPDPVQLKTGSQARRTSSGGADPQDPLDHPPDPPDPPDPTRGLTNTQRQTLFHREMCLNCVPVWKTLDASDATRSGLVEQEVLRNVLCNFLFPMSLPSFQQLTRGYRVKGSGPVKWKHFLGHFLNPAERTDGRTDGRPPSADGSLHQLHPEEISSDLEEEVYSRLKEIFLLLDPSGSGGVARAELRRALEGPCPPQLRGRPPDGPPPRPPGPRLGHARVGELLNLLDPGHTGLVHGDRLETLRPGRGATPGGRGPPSPPCPGGPGQDPGGGLGSGVAALRLSDPGARWATPSDDLMRSHPAGPLSHTHPDQGSPRPDLIGQDHCGLDLTGTEPTGGDLIGPDLTKPDRSSRRHGSPDLNGLAQSSLDLIGTYLAGPDPTGPGLPGPDLNGPEPRGPDFTGTHLTGLDHFGPDHSSPDHGSIDRGSPDLVEADLTGPGHGGPAPSPPQCPTWSPGGAGVPGLLEVVFRRVWERLERRGTTLAARIQAIALPSLDGTLSQRDLRKILEDSWVVLEDGHFLHVTRLLGFRQGRLDQSTLLDRYQEFSSGAVKQNGDGRHGDEHNNPHSLSAEECLAFMRAKMADDRADGVAAFKMRTADGDGMVDAADLRDTIRSLGLVASELEFQRLLRLIGLQPGAKLPRAHLRQNLQKAGARGRSLGTMNVLDQIQEQLASDLRYKRAFMLQALRGPEEEDRDLVFKRSLRNQLFTYDLPLRPAEFEQLWLRFDPEGRGCVTLVDFLNKLGVKHDGKSRASVLPGSADEAGRGRDPDVLSEAAELLEAKLPLDTGHRKSAYQDFLSALQPQGVEEGRSPTETPRPACRVETLHGLAPDRALSRLRELVRDSAPVLHKAFSTFDPGRAGRVSGAELRRVLESVCARLSDGQYRHMLGELGLNWEPQTVDWKLFLARLQSPCQLAAAETSSRPIKEVLAQIQEAVSGHLFDVTKAMWRWTNPAATASPEKTSSVCVVATSLSPPSGTDVVV
ncbi:EF-hand calcium-binding domain-containing protein 6 [Gadus macrocephalus]|uniref:EF-hand calcium-binding domain-containing protein 6 n=1 Tax=Gadus macrocephalus TaxID=80720 RepID=UPI0028CB37C7|nr:EF-hand calcium-binding domain-containing protein 6 [Gadus macrocephalus]